MYSSITFFASVTVDVFLTWNAWANFVKWSETKSNHSWPELDLGVGPTMSIATLCRGWPHLTLIKEALGTLGGSLTSAHGPHLLIWFSTSSLKPCQKNFSVLYRFRHNKVACRLSIMKGVQHFRDKTFWKAKLLVSFLASLFILPAPEH